MTELSMSMVEFFFHLKKTTKRILSYTLLFLFALILTTSRAPTTLEEVQNNGVLRVVTLPGSTTYFENAKGQDGFEYILTKAFADSLGVSLEVTPMPSLTSVLLAIGGPNGHMGAAGLTITPKRQQTFRFSQPYYWVEQKLLYKNGTKRPKKIEDLVKGLGSGTLLAMANSSHSERLAQLKLEYPNLKWQETKGLEMQDLMSMVHSGEVNYAVIDSTAYAIDRAIYPKARAAFNLSAPEAVGWAFPLHGDSSLIQAANQFISDYESSGKLEKLKQQSLEQTHKFNQAGSQLFKKMLLTRLPKYQDLFQEIAQKNNMDWHLLSAISYQESHWNPKAKSPTGVRGLMMLTRPTAKEMGVTDRVDPRQSIEGGVKYFLQTKSRIPKDITDPDRTLLALAAYNVGMGHLEDARVLTERAGKNPDLWQDVKEFLPLLEKKQYYSTVRYGYAKGREPVQYVENILRYKSVLKRHSLERQLQKDKQTIPEIPNSSDWSPDALLSL